MGFASRTSEVFRPFASAVLPAVFILGIFTVARLVDTGIEYQQALSGIARIRSYYRTLTPEAATHFSAENGRWPAARAWPKRGSAREEPSFCPATRWMQPSSTASTDREVTGDFSVAEGAQLDSWPLPKRRK
jgi:hypothetical protein